MDQFIGEEELDRQLREAAPYIDDDGFTRRVLKQLPVQPAPARLRGLILILTATLASVLTYVVSGGGRFFLAAVIDLYSRFCVGWAVSAVNDRHLTIRALEMAIRRRCPQSGLIHHSDQGSTYASEDYQRLLSTHGITCSMSRRGNCLDNAAMESWFSTVKHELGETFESIHRAKEQLFDYIEVFYNQQRRHSSIDYVSPARYERERTDQLAA